MFATDTICRIRQCVQQITGIQLPFDVETTQGAGLCVSLADSRAQIAAEDENALARGFFLLSRCVKEGKTSYYTAQKRHFSSCGAMLDMSRGAVMKPEAVKR